MPNLALYKEGSDEVLKFFIDAEIRENWIEGDNLRVTLARRPHNLRFFWTDDIANPIYDVDGTISGYDKVISDLAPAAESGPEVVAVTRREKVEALKMRNKLSKMSKTAVENYVQTQLSDPQKTKELIADITQILWAHIKFSDYHRNKG